VPGKTTAYTFSFSASAEFEKTDVLQITFPQETTILKHTGRRCDSIFTPETPVTCSETSANVVQIKGLFPTNMKQYAVTVQ
jgi:hypothetical protein